MDVENGDSEKGTGGTVDGGGGRNLNWLERNGKSACSFCLCFRVWYDGIVFAGLDCRVVW